MQPQQPQAQQAQSPAAQPQEQQDEEAARAGANYDQAIFQKPLPVDQLSFLNLFTGEPARDLARDKRFRKLIRNVLPDCRFAGSITGATCRLSTLVRSC